ncbi:MAG: hypothetical protein HY518_05275 [Candidatus Aenigmarchaeota archaeon]|nr:hypothetical protein [Candidatus Aenigmarchaeota archaeon]
MEEDVSLDGVQGLLEGGYLQVDGENIGEFHPSGNGRYALVLRNPGDYGKMIKAFSADSIEVSTDKAIVEIPRDDFERLCFPRLEAVYSSMEYFSGRGTRL